MTTPQRPICGIILAAGQSTRMGTRNKLLETWGSKPLLRHVADAALASKLKNTVAVLGHEADTVERALPDDFPTFVNGDFANGMAGSLRAGLYRLQGLAHVMVLLGDMPLINADHINEIITAFENHEGNDCIVVATHNGKWGNPVLFGVDYFTDLKLLDGDSGARSVMNAHHDKIIEVEIGAAASKDFDTPEAFLD